MKIFTYSFLRVFHLVTLLCFLSSNLTSTAQSLSIGDDSYSDYMSPIFSCYSYNYSQQIYTVEEMEDAGAEGAIMITKISFKVGFEDYSVSSFDDWEIFLGNSNQNSFLSSSNWVPAGVFAQVYEGTIASISSETYIEFVLDEPFFWDGVSNLIVAVHENAPGYDCTQDWISYYPVESRSLLFYSDDIDPDPLEPMLGATEGPGYSLAHVVFEYEEAAVCEEESIINAGTISGENVCPNNPFTIINTDGTGVDGLQWTWQTRVPSGTGEWTTVEEPLGINYYVELGIDEATDYRCILSCPSSGIADTTNELTINVNDAADCYCVPDISSYCMWDAVIEDVFSTGASVDLLNMGSGCSGPYTDYFEELGASAIQGTEVTLNIGIDNSDAGVKVWIDWNQDGTFTIDELVIESEDYVWAGSTFDASFLVPYDAVLGTTRMRIVAASYTTFFDPCMSDMWDGGEVEDYYFTVIEAIPCEELELVAGTLTPFEICPSAPFTVINSGSSLGSGFERTWQQRIPSGTGPWTTVSTGTSVNYTNDVGITEPADYRCIVLCTSSEEADTTNIITVTISPFIDCYCEPEITYDCTWEATIDGVSTSGAMIDISNLETGCTGGYTDYSDEYVVTGMQLSTITTSIDITNSDGGVKIWIDWDQNGIFDSDELVGASGSFIYYSTFDATFTVPLTAVPGLTKMRVATRSWSTIFDPCMSEMWDGGEVEDYGFIVVPAPTCSEVDESFWPTEVNPTASPAAVCGTGNVFLNLDIPMPLASGITYQWESSTTGIGGWTSISDPSLFPNLLAEGITSSTYFRSNIMCEGETYYYSESLLVESVAPETPLVYEGQNCGPGSVELTGEIGEGIIFWYENPEGGIPFASGELVSTPEISTTTTFYADGGAFPAALIEVGTGTASSSMYSDGGPFKISYSNSYTNQFLYTAAQIADAGGVAGLIEDVRFNLASLPSEGLPDYTISMKLVPSTMTSITWQTTGMTEVYYNALFEPEETGWQIFPLTTPFDYDGVSGIMVQVCWSPVEEAYTYTGTHKYTNKSGQMLCYGDWTSACDEVGTWTSNELPNVIFGFTGCVSERVPVIAHIREVPTINIDVEDGDYCLYNNEFIIPSSPEQPESSTYLWNTGETTSSITVSGSGVETDFWVEVTNEWGCQNSDTATLTLKVSPEVDLGPDVAVCEGGIVTLDAGTDGHIYYWNTSETTQTIDVDNDGQYTVLVTNSFGCMGTDTILVTVEGFAPSIDGIIVDNLSPTTFSFTPLHPENILTYKWSFGDGYESAAESPTHNYELPGTYNVTLEITSDCGVDTHYTFATVLLGVDNEALSNTLKIYPNPSQQYLNIETSEGVKMELLTIANNLGQEVIVRKLDNIEKFKLDVNDLPSGMYHILIESNKGKMVKKFQVIR